MRGQETARHSSGEQMVVNMQILHTYGELLCEEWTHYVRDEECLPAPKQDIKALIMLAIVTAQSEEQRSQLANGDVLLANFQKHVGNRAILFSSLTSATIPELHEFGHLAELVEKESAALMRELELVTAKLNAKGDIV